jgi:hypothetical protein
MCSTTVAHFFCMRFFWRRSYMTAAVHDPVIERNIIQLREGSLKRKFGSPMIVSCTPHEIKETRTHHPPHRIRRLLGFAGSSRSLASRRCFCIRFGHTDVDCDGGCKVGRAPKNFLTVGERGIESERANHHSQRLDLANDGPHYSPSSPLIALLEA